MRYIYMENSYITEFESTVSEANGNVISLENTAFFPAGGGVPCDLGTIESDKGLFRVTSVTKDNGKILHHLDGAEFCAGDSVRGVIDWQRRYTLMRHHTSAHLIASILYRDFGVLITGNQLDVDKSRMDFSFENFDKSIIEDVVEKANGEIKKDLPVKIYFLPREDAEKIPGIVKLAGAMPPSVSELRIVEIDGLDIQADGGCHVKRLGEIGKIKFIKADNKGKNNRRIYYTVS